MTNPHQDDTDDFIFMAFRSEEFADKLDYLEDTYDELHKELTENVYKHIMGAIDGADRELAKQKPYLRVVK